MDWQAHNRYRKPEKRNFFDGLGKYFDANNANELASGLTLLESLVEHVSPEIAGIVGLSEKEARDVMAKAIRVLRGKYTQIRHERVDRDVENALSRLVEASHRPGGVT